MWTGFSLSLLFAGLLAAEPATHAIQLERDVPATMRDGVVLRADVLRPEAPGTFPVILVRTPYGKEDEWRDDTFAIRAARAGYIVVLQDVRGRYASEGVFDPYRQEGADGYDSVEWAAALPGANGRVGMAGLSYPGAVQWHAAVESPPHLEAIAPAMCFSSPRHFFYVGGAFDLSWIPWFYLSIAPDVRRRLDVPGPRTYLEASALWETNSREWLSFRPLKDLPALRGVAPSFYEWLDHPEDGPYWDFARIEAKYDRVRVPSLNLSGWHDEGYGPPGAVTNFNGTRHHGSRLIMGPWTHGTPTLASTKEGELDFGVRAGFDYETFLLRWFDFWLKDIDNGVDEESPVLLFVMGENRWREEEAWPLERTAYTSYYFHEGGALSESPPGSTTKKPYDGFTYDPTHPVTDPNGGVQGPFDQRVHEVRRDVLVYSTPPLEEDLEVTGPIEVELFASSSARDTDFVVRLLDVHPDGRAFNLMSPTLEVLRARFRKDESAPEILTPGHVERFVLDNMLTSNVFKAGHRIRVHVTSSFFPHFDANPNTGAPFAESDRTVPAEQRIYRSATRPSRIVLPVIPR